MTGATRRNLSQAIADGILDLIRNGEFRPGERLPTERGLMEIFGAGRNTVREALQVLVSRGVLDVRPGRGTTVQTITSQEVIDPATFSALLADQAIDDLYDFRRLVEVEATARAAKHARPAQIEKMEEHLAAFEHAYRERLPTVEHDVNFHRAVVEASGNVIYASVLDAVTDKLVAVRRETQHVPRAVQIAIKEHRAILRSVKRHDVDGARLAMSRHIDSAIWALAQARLGRGISLAARTPPELPPQ